MKLKCDTHGRRVLSVPTSYKFLHRTGDMRVCDSNTATLRDNISRTSRVFAIVKSRWNEQSELISSYVNKE